MKSAGKHFFYLKVKHVVYQFTNILISVNSLVREVWKVMKYDVICNLPLGDCCLLQFFLN